MTSRLGNITPRLEKQQPLDSVARIVERAGLEKWPKLIHALRASIDTELEGTRFTSSRWLGDTTGIAEKHYLVVSEDDTQKAAEEPAN